MSEFDPISLHPYRPSLMLTLKEFHHAIVYIMANVRERALEKAKLDIGPNHPIYKNIEEYLAKIRDDGEDWKQYESKQGWQIVWDELLNEKVIAFAFDDDFRMRKVDRDFWTSSYAAKALSTGVVEKIPLYKPNGILYINERNSYELFSEYEKGFVEAYNAEISGCIDRYEDPAAFSDFRSLIEHNFSKKRGRKPTYDVKTLLLEAARLIFMGDVPNSSHGSMKAWRARLVESYVKVHGENDLPSDDTLSRELSPIFKGVERLPKQDRQARETTIAQIENRANASEIGTE